MGVGVGVGVEVEVEVGVEVGVSVGVGGGVKVRVELGAGVEVGVSVEVEAAVEVGVAVAGNVAVEVGVGVTVIVGVTVAVGVGVAVAVGVAINSITSMGAKRNWNTVAMATARGKTAIFRYSPKSAGTELRKFISLAQLSLKDTATKGICQVHFHPANLEPAHHLPPLPSVCAPVRSPQFHTSPACLGQRLSTRTRLPE